MWLLLIISTLLSANQPYSWALKSSKSSVYVNEAVEIEYTCTFDDQGYLYVIEFYPDKETRDYRLLPLGVVEKVIDGRRSDTYRYVLFPKVAGEKEFKFEVLMRQTTKASIENSVIGRDNVEDYSFDDTQVVLPSLHLYVKDHQEKMTGSFTLNVTLDKQSVKAYEPVHLDVHLKGEGDFDQMQDYNLSIDGVNVFSEPGQKRYKLTKNGFAGEWEQKFSLVGSKEFIIPPIILTYFDIAKQKRVVLRSKSFNVKVEAAYSREELLNVVEDDDGSSWWSWWYLNYLFTFATGIYVGRYIKSYRIPIKQIEGFSGEVNACQSVRQLLTKLVLQDDVRFDVLINKYEKQGNKASLKSLKNEINTLLKSDTITEQKGKNA